MRAAAAGGARGTVLLTGGTGFIGTLIAAVLLGQERRRVVALVRGRPQAADLTARILPELDAAAEFETEAGLCRRLTIMTLPDIAEIHTLAPELKRLGVTEIVHCAGCVNYFNTEELERTNIVLTEHLLALARLLKVERFIYISTAYSSGYLDHPVAEALHCGSPKDPTEYVRTKREAERRVADGGVPYLIIRPSIVIGDSRTGRYSGKRYGLYQYWSGWERLLIDHYRPEFHMVAPNLPVNFVHQDAFQNAFRAAYRSLEPGTIINLTSDSSKAPTARALCDMWLAAIGKPERCHYYDRLSEVPLNDIHQRQRAFLMFASVNMEISAHAWQFDNGWMNHLRGAGLKFADATLETISICQTKFMSASPRLRTAMAQVHENDRQAMRVALQSREHAHSAAACNGFA